MLPLAPEAGGDGVKGDGPVGDCTQGDSPQDGRKNGRRSREKGPRLLREVQNCWEGPGHSRSLA
jgi:hypothetical protein